ncbi:MAG: phage gp6-like head-tail connector protein, partial [Caulobacter sp.]
MPQALTLAEARAFLRVSDASEDALLTLLIDA